MNTSTRELSRRSFLRTGAAFGLATVPAGFALPALASSDLPNIQSVLDKISVAGYVREDYRKLYSMTDDPLWDPKLAQASSAQNASGLGSQAGVRDLAYTREFIATTPLRPNV